MSNLDDLSSEADRCGFWNWFIKWFVRILRVIAAMPKHNEVEDPK